MAFDTQAINKQRQNLADYDEIWLFGYGSLIYKVDFDYIASEYAYINGYARRFWQGSHDHRGTPESPGRVLTLTPVQGERCFGRAFKVNHEVFEQLDHREKNGYLRHEIPIHLSNNRIVNGLIYIASPDNAAYLGEASIEYIAKQIFNSSGPSGLNRDYVYELEAALKEHDEVDEHVFQIKSLLKSLEKS
ncbi:gamma-glutamylcyclotransferase [Aliiglaciecola sp. NS0011-25]|uniref:gamma-glutamylcyclotransferase n=1 Tax=Aliiglaciecola sp. NS0011-25 TaxID=3127654 RepID=UPI00310BB755